MNIKFIFSDLQKLETNRLILRKMRLDNAEGLVNYASKYDVCRFVSWQPHKSIEDSIYTNTNFLLWFCSSNRR